jgi:golgi SNAP receptor complex member 2
LTSFSRTVDDYAKLAKQEPVAVKQEKAFERLKQFRGELAEYREQFQRLKSLNEDVVCRFPRLELVGRRKLTYMSQQTTAARTELLGRRPHHASTPENPYSNSPAAAPYRPNQSSSSYAATSLGAAPEDYSRESHAFREQSFLTQTGAQLDEFLDRGRAVLGDLGQQREMLKGTQRRLYSVANTLGVSGDTIRMVERRARQDKWIFWAGVVIFFGFCWLVLHYLR